MSEMGPRPCKCGCGRPAREGPRNPAYASDACKAEFNRRVTAERLRTRPASTPEKRTPMLLRLLTQAGEKGLTTHQLLESGVGSRYGARIRNLREAGYEITTDQIGPYSFRYRLETSAIARAA